LRGRRIAERLIDRSTDCWVMFDCQIWRIDSVIERLLAATLRRQIEQSPARPMASPNRKISESLNSQSIGHSINRQMS
jgi:hypothetical protein